PPALVGAARRDACTQPPVWRRHGHAGRGDRAPSRSAPGRPAPERLTPVSRCAPSGSPPLTRAPRKPSIRAAPGGGIGRAACPRVPGGSRAPPAGARWDGGGCFVAGSTQEDVVARDNAQLESLGIKPQLNRTLGFMANFALAFSFISVS